MSFLKPCFNLWAGTNTLLVVDGQTQDNCVNVTLAHSFQVAVALMQAGNSNISAIQGRECELQIFNFFF